jgi:hypothetical protein
MLSSANRAPTCAATSGAQNSSAVHAVIRRTRAPLITAQNFIFTPDDMLPDGACVSTGKNDYSTGRPVSSNTV